MPWHTEDFPYKRLLCPKACSQAARPMEKLASVNPMVLDPLLQRESPAAETFAENEQDQKAAQTHKLMVYVDIHSRSKFLYKIYLKAKLQEN